MRILEEPRQATTDLPDAGALVAEALIKEARQRQRKRWLVIACVVVLGMAAVLVAHTYLSAVRSASPGTRTRESAGLSPCASAQLGAAFWATPASMQGQIDGLNLRNTSSAVCSLMGYPSAIAMLTSDGHVLAPVALPLPDGEGSTWTDFLNLASLPSPEQADFQVLGRAVSSSVMLRPGGRAAIFFRTYTSVDPPATSTCISPLGLRVTLPDESTLNVTIPKLKATYAAGNLDPTGSPFWSCVAVVTSPFMSWTAAQRTLDTGPLTLPPGVDNYIYEAAPTTSIPVASTPSSAKQVHFLP